MSCGVQNLDVNYYTSTLKVKQITNIVIVRHLKSYTHSLSGRLGFGWVTESNYMTISNFMCVVLALQGVFIAVFPFSSSLIVLSTLLVLYGMTAGSILVLFPVLVFKYVDVSEQPVAMSCVGFLSGLVSFGIAPMIGEFANDVVRKHDLNLSFTMKLSYALESLLYHVKSNDK